MVIPDRWLIALVAIRVILQLRLGKARDYTLTGDVAIRIARVY
jgi:hypothetical protein